MCQTGRNQTRTKSCMAGIWRCLSGLFLGKDLQGMILRGRKSFEAKIRGQMCVFKTSASPLGHCLMQSRQVMVSEVADPEQKLVRMGCQSRQAKALLIGRHHTKICCKEAQTDSPRHILARATTGLAVDAFDAILVCCAITGSYLLSVSIVRRVAQCFLKKVREDVPKT